MDRSGRLQQRLKRTVPDAADNGRMPASGRVLGAFAGPQNKTRTAEERGGAEDYAGAVLCIPLRQWPLPLCLGLGG
jgi:hypothetical protein